MADIRIENHSIDGSGSGDATDGAVNTNSADATACANTRGRVHSLETFGLVDGPGVRCVVFMKGCRMRCRYCPKPETWQLDAGELWTPGDLFDKVYRYHNYWKEKGGITVSGGEPLLQMEFVTELFELAKQRQVHTALDTSGNPFSMDSSYLRRFDRLMDVTDLFLLDIKAMDEPLHKSLTGQTNTNILEMAHYLAGHQKDIWIRHVLVPGLTDSEEDLLALRDLAQTLPTLRRMEVLPYHTLGRFKWDNLGIPYSLDGVTAPTAEEVARAEKVLGIT
ncbi:MAG: pyruvate formate lyase-activating protein [Lachnospiraceae bacterium]|nr:pyruvate formate lyase-activating protein [Lachnospiraceae bacterium]